MKNESSLNITPELIAAITAALAFTLKRNTSDIYVRSIKQTTPIARPWNQLGRQEQLATKLNARM